MMTERKPVLVRSKTDCVINSVVYGLGKICDCDFAKKFKANFRLGNSRMNPVKQLSRFEQRRRERTWTRSISYHVHARLSACVRATAGYF
eukprot:IDg6860t1